MLRVPHGAFHGSARAYLRSSPRHDRPSKDHIVTTVGKCNGSCLVLLDLSAAFDTIDHDNLFYILEKYVGIGGSALWLIRSYFCDRTQIVQIDGIMSDFASLLCGCHRAQL